MELGEVTNRDPRRFEAPDEFDITRENNAHLGFSHGIHYCVGAALAREEAGVGFTRLLTRLPDLHLATPPDQVVWRRRIRALATLPVRFTPSGSGSYERSERGPLPGHPAASMVVA